MLSLLGGIAQGANHIAERKQTRVDVDALLGAISRGVCALEALGPLARPGEQRAR